MIGFNESVTFQRSPTITGMADLSRIHIKEALGCNSEHGTRNSLFCDLQRESEAERTGEESEGEQRKQVWKKKDLKMIKIPVTKH